MAAKRIRCICGKIYDPEESKVCPSCGTEVRIESISVIAPEAEPAPAPVVPAATGATPVVPRRIPRIWIVGGACLVAAMTAIVWHLLQPDAKTGAPDRGSSGASADESAAGNTKSNESNKSNAAPVLAEEKSSVVKKEEAPPPGPSSDPGPKQWIVEAGESEEVGGAALEKALGKAVQGDTVLLKPGTYAGAFTVGNGIRLAGEAGGAGLPVIKMASKRILIEVEPPGATLENLKIVFASEGSTPGLKVNPGAKLAVAGCEVQATGGNCIMGLPTSSVTATKSAFTSQGSVAVMLAQASGQFTGCSFLNSRIGLAVAGDGRVELNDCIFEKCGPKNGPQNGARAEEGYIAKADGSSKAGVRFTDCKFSGNTGGILVTQGMSAALTMCAFSGNGFPENSPLFSQGLFAVSAGGKVVLTGVTFQGDRQGLGVYPGGALEMTDCRLAGVGLKGGRKDIRFTGNSIFARGKAAMVRLKQCEIADAPGEVAVFASDGGAIEAEACEIRNAGFFAVYAGTGRDEAPCRVKLKGGRIVGNRVGLKVATGGTGSVEGTEFRQNVSGIEIADAGTGATFSKVVLTESRDLGLLVHTRADVTLSDCTIDNNGGGGAQVGVAGKPESRADLTIENCRIGSNTGFDIKAGTQSRLTVKNCAWTTPGGRPLLAIEQQTITQFEPPLGGLATGVVMPAKKVKQTASNDEDTPARPRPPQRVAPSRTPPSDPVGQAIDAINRLRRIIR